MSRLRKRTSRRPMSKYNMHQAMERIKAELDTIISAAPREPFNLERTCFDKDWRGITFLMDDLWVKEETE